MYTWREVRDALDELPTQAKALTDDLKYTDGTTRVWVSRVSEDLVTVEKWYEPIWFDATSDSTPDEIMELIK
ncbi:hypothetical protein [Actinomadura rubrisoli]|uniref:Uncharacterized protein n=1 Tax=Actinomadura rubrisoli TaxID=2530368 RepID=A0A4R5CFK1_9ACTN|nr:hypothetical protein [Actinomadura rubrisoli]TDD97180.1 hypothetical protein E1298_01725 [Actinomadura rubrisoli]